MNYIVDWVVIAFCSIRAAFCAIWLLSLFHQENEEEFRDESARSCNY